MTLMTPIFNMPPTTAEQHLTMIRADRLMAFAAVAGEMLAEIACILDTAETLPPEQRRGLFLQSWMRMKGVVLLSRDLGDATHEAVTPIIAGLTVGPRPLDAAKVRDAAVSVEAAIGMELHQIKIGIAYDRYA